MKLPHIPCQIRNRYNKCNVDVVPFFRQIIMYNIYVTNKTGSQLYVRLQNEKLSAANPNFCFELDKAKGNVTSYRVQWGFCSIPSHHNQTLPFAVDLTHDRMYASFYASNRLFMVDYEINCSQFGCVFVSLSPNFHVVQTNPEPVWIPAKKGDTLKGKIVKAGPQSYFGRLSANANLCILPSRCHGRSDIHLRFNGWL